MPTVGYSCAVCGNLFERETLSAVPPNPRKYETCPTCGANLYIHKPTTRLDQPQRFRSFRSWALGLFKSRKSILGGLAALAAVLIGSLLWWTSSGGQSKEGRVVVLPQHPVEESRKSNDNSQQQTRLKGHLSQKSTHSEPKPERRKHRPKQKKNRVVARRMPIQILPPPPPVKQEAPPPRPTPVPSPVLKVEAPKEGLILYRAKLNKQSTFTIQGGSSTDGDVISGALPGRPVKIEVSPNYVVIVERPNPANYWSRISLRSNKKMYAVVSINWRAIPE
jgi:hypothetical protein